MRSKCIMVAGFPCGGTSCIAGILHNVGVNMGRSAQVPGAKYHEGWISYVYNPKGQYEDDPSVKLSWAILGGSWLYPKVPEVLPERHQRALDELVEDHCKAPLWGLKLPSFSFTGRHFLNAIVPYAEVHLVVVYRDEYVTAEHLSKRHAEDGIRPMAAQSYIGEASRALWRLMGTATHYKVPCTVIHYEDIVGDPPKMVPRLLAEVFKRWDKPTPEQVQKAIDFVDPTLNHAEPR